MAFASITINIVLTQMNIGASKDWAKLWSYLCGAAPPFESWNLSSSFFAIDSRLFLRWTFLHADGTDLDHKLSYFWLNVQKSK